MDNSIIRLKNVSKFYYSKGVIASGFVKLNLEFEMGEFVAITGESGSGKSTLLNVISGLDTYEEGEMYINGEETSHYSEKDFEIYRRRYIGNIFQNFNLVNSYTVYQNVELVMLLNGDKKKDIKKRVIELIKTVGLYNFRNTKVSKLSGGQKQRVAIARALAKDTPIIIADEPTGNLDSKSAKGIIKLLSEIAKDKLVIVVTHNYEQVEEYVTRKIKMHDGKVLEDKVIKDVQEISQVEEFKFRDIKFFSKLRLGIRNSFNIVPKFLLILAVYLFIIIALMAEYSAFKKQEYIEGKAGYNYVFQNTDDTRIIIKKNDGSSFNEEDYDEIDGISNIDSIVKNDLLLDNTVSMTDNNFWIYGTVNNIDNLRGKIDKGRLPENDNEVVIRGSQDDYYLGYMASQLLDKELYLEDMYTGEANKDVKLKVVGIQYREDGSYYRESELFVSDVIQDKLSFQINQQYSKVRVLFRDKYYQSSYWDTYFRVSPNSRVQDGNVYISGDLSYLCKNYNCIGETLGIENDNLYYKDNKELKVSKVYDNKNFKSLLGDIDYEYNNGSIFISINDYNSLFNKDNYQSSIFVEDVRIIDDTIGILNDKGYATLKISDTLVKDNITEVLRILRTVVTIVLVVVLFFISYFVIKLILKSRNVYFTIIRMLGATKAVSRELLIIELLVVANLAYLLWLGILCLTKIEVIDIGFINNVIDYMMLKDYIILYGIVIFMSGLISVKFSKKLFKNSVMNTIREEV